MSEKTRKTTINRFNHDSDLKIEESVSIILANPDLPDPNFAKSSILLVEHYEEGAMGLIFNYPSHLTLGVFARNLDIDVHPSLENYPIFKGGPVDTSAIFIIHSNETLEEKKEICANLYISNSDESLKTLLSDGKKNFKIIMGYSAWGEKQLETEMAEGSWISAPIDLEHVFHTDPNLVWLKSINDMGLQPQQILFASSEIH